MKKFLGVGIVVICCSVLLYADLSISPAVINVVATDDAIAESTYKVVNNADTKVSFTVSVEDWKNYSQNGNDVTAERWLKLPKTEFEIAPKATVEVPFRVETFKGMKGSVSAMVVFSNNKGSMINMVMKVPVYIIIEGTENIDFKIDSLNIVKEQSDNLSAYLTIKNDGNVHIRHTGKVEVVDTKTGNIVKEIDIEESFPTYCESSRDFALNIAAKDELKAGKYLAKFEIKALGKFVDKSVRFEILKDGNIEIKN